MNPIPSDQWKAAIKAVFDRSATDADFREKCLSDPVEAIRLASGLDVPANSAIKFSETAEGDAIVLPVFAGRGDEITDDDILDNVAGGGGGGVSRATPQPGPPGMSQCC